MTEPVSIATILIVCATGFVSYRAFGNEQLHDSLLFDSVSILRDRQYRRIITSGLIHADWPHLLFNMFSLYSFGKYIELVYGAAALLAIYLASIVGGGLLALLLHRGHEYRALGASGGVCGVIFASVFLLPGGGVRLFLFPVALPAWAFAILFILASFYGIRTRRDNIGHDAHLGGALVGLGVAAALYPDIVFKSPLLLVAVVVLTIALAAFMFRFPRFHESAAAYGRGDMKRAWAQHLAQRREINRRRNENRLNALLEKISEHGLEALSDHERQELENLSRNRQRRS